MLPPRRLLPLRAVLRTLPLWDSVPVLGTLILGAPGAGKTILLSLILLCHLIRGLPGCVLDMTGSLSDAFLFRLLWFLSEYPPGDDEFFWQRLRYIPLGDESVVTHFPIYFQRKGETLWDASSRLITVLERASPQLTQAPLTWPAARRLALNAGMVLTALSFQLDKVEDLLFQTIEWEKSGTFDEATRRNPQAEPAVAYFRNYYLPLPRSEQRRIAGTLLDQVSFIQNPQLRAIFSGSNTPGIDWEEEEAFGRIVVINCKGITDPTSRSFATQWLFESLYPHLRTRGRRDTPFVLLIDEFANLAAQGTTDNKPLAELFDELLAQYARNNQVFVTLALQSLDQVPERLAQTLLRLATIITGRAGSMREARQIGDHLFRKDIYRIHHYKKVFGKVDPVPLIRGVGYQPPETLSQDKLSSSYYPYYILENEPQYMSLDLQAEDAAGRIQQLGALEFLCRPAVSEGAVSQDVISLALSDAITDPDTGEGIFPDPEQDAALIAQIQHALAARSGIPIAEILQEQEAWLTDSISQNPSQSQTHPVEEVREQQPSQLPDVRLPEHRTAKRTPSLPTLAEKERAFLAFVAAHPDLPINQVYKGLGIKAAEVTKIRENLKTQGLIAELEVRPSETGAGRPLKCLVPTMQAFTLLGCEPPAGRGGVIHRHLQQLIAAGATAKGYTTHCEKELGTGAIVDVHLEKGGERVAVEIAVMSHPSRELAHIRQTLSAGYDKVFTVFLDSQLLEKTREALGIVFSDAELSRIQLIPVSKLAGIG